MSICLFSETFYCGASNPESQIPPCNIYNDTAVIYIYIYLYNSRIIDIEHNLLIQKNLVYH